MRCPYCGIHYMDDERECPICGKRPGIFAPQKETASPPKRNHRGAGCLIVIVAVICICFASALTAALFSYMVPDPKPEGPQNNFANIEISESCEIYDVFPVGTWINDDNAILLTDDSGKFSWTDADQTRVVEEYFPWCARLDLTEDNAEEYCFEEELDRYPVTEYTRYTLYAEMIDICIYIPNDASRDSITSFDYFDFTDNAFHTFQYVSDENMIPDIPIQTT